MRPANIDPTPCSSGADELRAALEKAGWRFTRQRAAVFDYLRKVDSHPTAEEVFAAVRQVIENISLATVYKALEALVDSKMATKLAYSDGPARYDIRADEHHHLRCLTTNQVRDLPVPYDPQLLDKVDPTLIDQLRQQGFQVTGYRLEVLGHFEEKTEGP
jgi:Fe2+ or Zn2+ uptake regulation protein